MRGKFITLEGADGSGKSTFVRLLEKRLLNLGIKVLVTREPGGTRIGEQIRSLLLDPDHEEMSAYTEALLYAASRAQHVAEVIEPALASGIHVVCERYVLSSVAYQGYGRELGEDPVREINDFAVQGLFPELTLFFSIDPKITLLRKAADPDRLEEAGLGFHRRVYAGYSEAIKRYPSRVVEIDATMSVEEVFECGWNEIDRFLKGSETE